MYSIDFAITSHQYLYVYLGTKNLSELLTEREEISNGMKDSLDEATDPWGVKVERVEMSVIII